MTKQVRCGDLLIGGGAPITIQSMTNVDSRDEKALLEQIARLTDAECQIVRIAVPDREAADVFGNVKKSWETRFRLLQIYILITGWRLLQSKQVQIR